MSNAERAPFAEDVVRRAGMAATSFHMPGHKQRSSLASPELAALWGEGLFRSDLSEIGGVDYLHAPTGALGEAQRLAAEFAGADATYFLVNGSTSGNLAALLATVRPGRQVLLPRASHRSLYAGLLLADAEPLFIPPLLHPQAGLPLAADAEQAEVLLAAHGDVDALVITSPTYYGCTSDVSRFAELAHRRGVPLLVDEAHGAHFGLHPSLPTPALRQGADLVIQSTHKTLGSLYQSSMLHYRLGHLDRRRLEQALAMLQSSSPSALLLASLDAARAQAAAHGAERMGATLQRAAAAREAMNRLPGLRCLGPELIGAGGVAAYDPTKLLVKLDIGSLSGYLAARWLSDQHGVEAELATPRYLLFSLTMADTDTDVDHLLAGLRELSRNPPTSRSSTLSSPSVECWPPVPRRIQSLRTAAFARSEPCPIQQAIGRVCAENVIPYPPGIPLLTPGEEIAPDTLEFLQDLIAHGAEIVGAESACLQTIRVVCG